MLKNKWIFLMILSSIFIYGVLNCTPVFAQNNNATITRLLGSNRYDTSVAISKAGFSQAATVIIVSGSDYQDALLSTPLSKLKAAPILLAGKSSLDSITIGEIKRLKASKAFLIGDTKEIGIGVDKQLKGLRIGITRISGVDRYDISKKIAEIVGAKNGIIMAGNLDYANILSIAPIAGIKSMPILLSPKNSLNPKIPAFIKGKGIPVSYLVGGTGVLNTSIVKMVPKSKRLSGANNYSTNLSIINEFSRNLNFDTIYLASGTDFTESMSGSALAAKNNAPIFLTDKNSISQATIDFIKSKKVKHVVILGGVGSVSKSTEDKVKVTIESLVVHSTSVSLNKITSTLMVGVTDTLIATVKPSTTTNKAIMWTSSNKNVVTVDNVGKISAISTGTAIIKGTTIDGNKTVGCTVTVTNPVVKVTSVSLNKTLDTLTAGGTDTLIATVNPDTATNKAIMWTSSNNNIATVDNEGKLSAVSTGTVIIKATTIDGNKTADCTVTVNNPVVKVISVNLNKTSDILTVGGVDTLSATVTPNTATNKAIIWTSSNNNIVTVDDVGKVRAVSTGAAIIKATTIDGDKTVDCTVTVKNPVVKATSISLNKTSDDLTVGEIDNLSATITPYTSTNKYIIWTSSNSEIATVDITGKVTAVSTGSAIITVATSDGKNTANCIVMVTEAIEVTIPPAQSSLIIAIDIGHNAKYDSGAVGIRSEDASTKEVGTLVIQKLTDLGYTVIDCSPTNATSTTNALKQRVDIANAAHADYYLSIHFNIFNGTASGSEVYMGSNKIKTKAQAVLNNLVSLGYVNRGLKDNSRGLYVLKNTKMPAMLVECSFLDSVDDMARYDPDAIADALVNGLITGN